MKVGDTITLHAIVTGLGGVEGTGEPQFVQLDIGGKIINDVPAGFCQAIPKATGAVSSEGGEPIPPFEPANSNEDSVGGKFSDAPTATEEKAQSSQLEDNKKD